jgi:hypothetical protein
MSIPKLPIKNQTANPIPAAEKEDFKADAENPFRSILPIFLSNMIKRRKKFKTAEMERAKAKPPTRKEFIKIKENEM